MITVRGISKNLFNRMTEDLGSFASLCYEGADGTIDVDLYDTVSIKCYGFDSSVVLNMGARTTILDRTEYESIKIS